MIRPGIHSDTIPSVNSAGQPGWRRIAAGEQLLHHGDFHIQNGATLYNDGKLVLIDGTLHNSGSIVGSGSVVSLSTSGGSVALGDIEGGGASDGQTLLWDDATGGWLPGDIPPSTPETFPWANLTGVPPTFPPSSHAHSQAATYKFEANSATRGTTYNLTNLSAGSGGLVYALLITPVASPWYIATYLTHYTWSGGATVISKVEQGGVVGTFSVYDGNLRYSWSGGSSTGRLWAWFWGF